MSITSIQQDFSVKSGLRVLGTNVVTSSTGNTSTLQVDGGAAVAKNLIVGTTAEIFGATTLRAPLTIVDTSASTSTNSGALIVAGGAGIAGNLYVGGTLNFSSTLSGTISTATNLAGGATGSIPYQTGAGTTAFIPIGNSGFVLSSNGTTATWTSLDGLSAGQATTASNIAGGAQYQIPYQTGAGATAFEANLAYNYTSDTLQTVNAVFSGDVSVNGGDITTDQSTFNLINATATTVNFAGSGTNITIGALTGATTVRNLTTVSNTTAATSTTTGALQVVGGTGIGGSLFVGTTATVLSTVASTSTLQSNALYVAGGVGIGKSLYVTGEAVFANNVVFSGTSTYVYSTNTVYTDNLINVHVPAGSTGTEHTWTVDDGKDIGLIFHYYKTSDKNAFLGLANDTGYLEWYATGDESGGVFTGTSYGIFKTGGILLTDTTVANSTNSGALQVVGGVGIGGALYVGGALNVTGTITGSLSGTATSANNLTGGATGSIPYQTGAGATAFVPIGNSGFILQSNGTTATWVSLAGISAGQATTASNIAGGAQYQIPYQTGAGATAFEANLAYNYTSDTLQTVNAVFSGTANAGTTSTGALQVVGGVGIGGNLVVGGSSTVTSDLFVLGNETITGDLAVNGGDITSTAVTFNLLNATVTTLNIANSATAITIGQTTGYTAVRNLFTVTNTTDATSTLTGALQVRGGAGIGGTVYLGNTLTVTGIASFTNSTNAVATNDGALRVTGGAGIVKDVYVGGLITAGATQAATTGTTVSALFYNNTLLSSYTSQPITTLSGQNLDSFSGAAYRSAKYFCQVVSGSNVHVSEISVFHDGVKAYINEYGISTNNGQLGTFDATYGSGNVTITWNANTTTSMVVKLTRIAITV